MKKIRFGLATQIFVGLILGILVGSSGLMTRVLLRISSRWETFSFV
ncbi:hypothetical protein ACPJHQ_22185 [Rossellomorea sp. H39__3]